MSTKRGNPNFKPRWNRPTRSARLPADFLAQLEELARLADVGAVDLGELVRVNARLVRVNELVSRWESESKGKMPKYDRSWGKALHLIAELRSALNEQ